MARYIDAEELAKRIDKYVKPERLEEIGLIEWCKDECIRQAYCMPTADVVPRAEVERVYYNLQAVAIKKFVEELKQVHGVPMYNETYSGTDDALLISHENLDDFVRQYLKEKECGAEETSEDSNIVCENSEHLSKPPLGVKPCTIACEERIRELLAAAERSSEYMETYCMTPEERRGQHHKIAAWLQESILLMELVDKLDEKEACKWKRTRRSREVCR